jgi:hypothetical protein
MYILLLDQPSHTVNIDPSAVLPAKSGGSSFRIVEIGKI